MDQILLRGGAYRAVIEIAHGANCTSLQNERYGLSVLREVPEGQEKDNAFLYGMPLIFPANRISGGSFTFEGRRYDFGINEEKTGCQLHGCLHALPFTVLEKDESRVLCELAVKENSLYPSFPHDFSIRMEYALSDSGLSQTVEIFNRSNTNMPCLLGFHTTFNARTPKGEAYLVTAEVGDLYERNEKYLPTGIILPSDALTEELQNGTFSACAHKISRHYHAAMNGKMMLTDRESGLCIVYAPDRKYAYRLIFNGHADSYICLEPQNCLVDAVNADFLKNERGFDVIGAGKRICYTSKIYISEPKGDMK